MSAVDGAAPILIVEDEAPLRQTICWVLEDERWPVMTAADGEEAVQHAAERPPSLVVLDMALPRLDGFGVAARLRELYGRALPILVVTADGRAGEKASRVGAYAYLQKPFDLDDLIDAVRTGLQSSA